MLQASTTTRTAAADVPATRPATVANAPARTRAACRRLVSGWARWLHIYGSMFSLAIVLFFSITGITLNHQEWFADRQVTSERTGTMTSAWLRTNAAEGVDKLLVVEHLRSAGAVRGALGDFRIDDDLCDVSFRAPGYAVSVVVDRTTGAFTITETRMGLAAVINDLHKGRDTGPIWKAVIDIAAGLLVFISITGLVLLYFTYRHRLAGVILAAAGCVVLYMSYAAFVP